ELAGQGKRRRVDERLETSKFESGQAHGLGPGSYSGMPDEIGNDSLAGHARKETLSPFTAAFGRADGQRYSCGKGRMPPIISPRLTESFALRRHAQPA
ncbi:hypothetical protein, partial [Accumulibacter sp.]|uniref:hypothetical protein n=1 Tax=Accumulibacter sp. TaxID=2053492 RepID=UPI002BBC3D07